MPATKSELWAQLRNAVKIPDEVFKFGTINATNFVTLLDTLTQLAEGLHVPQTVSAFNNMKNNLASIVSNSSVLSPLVIELAQIGYNSNATGIAQALTDIFNGMTAASETVTSRAWTYGGIFTGAANVGTGTVYRLYKDKNNTNIEAGSYVGGITFVEVQTDKNTGATDGLERAIIRGLGVPPTDALGLGTAPGGTVNINATRSESGKLSNSSFETYTGTGATLAFTGWTTTTPADSAANTTTYYRKNPGTTTGTSIEFTDNNAVVQWISSATSRFDLNLPVFLIVRYRRETNCDGALTIRLGSKTEAVADLTSVTNATWYDLILGVTDSDGWYDNFKEDNSGLGVRIAITLASRTTGTLLIDNVILAQPTLFDGKYYLLTAGQTDFLKGDYWTFTDTVLNTGRIQTTMSRLFGVHLPHAAAGATYTDI